MMGSVEMRMRLCLIRAYGDMYLSIYHVVVEKESGFGYALSAPPPRQQSLLLLLELLLPLAKGRKQRVASTVGAVVCVALLRCESTRTPAPRAHGPLAPAFRAPCM
jgi:hypothetical protein